MCRTAGSFISRTCILGKIPLSGRLGNDADARTWPADVTIALGLGVNRLQFIPNNQAPSWERLQNVHCESVNGKIISVSPHLEMNDFDLQVRLWIMLPVPGAYLLIVPKTFLHFCFDPYLKLQCFCGKETNGQLSDGLDNAKLTAPMWVICNDDWLSSQPLNYSEGHPSHLARFTFKRFCSSIQYWQSWLCDLWVSDYNNSQVLISPPVNTLPPMRCCPSQTFGRYSKAVEYLYSWEC